jgi:dTDP-glucose 4,6-dehydratase
MSDRQRALVTGGAGFIGSHLCEQLLADGVDVIAMDNLLTGDLSNIEHLMGHERFRFVHQDVTDYIHVPGRLDYILHFASPASPIDYLQLPIQTLKVGSLGTHKALGLAREKKARLLLASTSEVYGDPLVHPQPEEYWGNVNPVGAARRVRRGQALRRGDDDGVPASSRRRDAHRAHLQHVRPADAPRRRPRAAELRGQALRGEDLTVFGDGSQTRAFCYVDDLVNGILKLLRSDEKMPTNIGNPREMTIKEFGEAVLKATGSSSKFVFKDLPQDDPKQRQPDISKAKRVLGWEPTVRLEDGLVKTVAWFKNKIANQAAGAR